MRTSATARFNAAVLARQQQETRRRRAKRAAWVTAALLTVPLILLIGGLVPAVGAALPKVVHPDWGIGATTSDGAGIDGTAKVSPTVIAEACRAPLMIRAISTAPRYASLTAQSGSRAVRRSYDCRTGEPLIEEDPIVGTLG